MCSKKRIKNISMLMIIFLIFYLPMTISSYKSAILDIRYNYSSAKETAEWINQNVSDDEILIEESVFCQSFIPYLKNIEVYDIYYENYFNKLKTYSDIRDKKKIDLTKYSGKYIVIYDSSVVDEYRNLVSLVYSSSKSLVGENFKIYYIK